MGGLSDHDVGLALKKNNGEKKKEKGKSLKTTQLLERFGKTNRIFEPKFQVRKISVSRKVSSFIPLTCLVDGQKYLRGNCSVGTDMVMECRVQQLK